MKPDSLFTYLESLQQGKPWGDVLDAGTGLSSLGWLLTLPTQSITAITACPRRAEFLRAHFSEKLRPQDRVLSGNWVDEDLLESQTFSVVLADYLVGAVDRFAPYFQERLLTRLRRHVSGTLYVIGLEPYGDPDESPDSQLVTRIANLRDACLLLAQDRPHREYPRWWMTEALERNGYQLQASRSFPVSYGRQFVTSELDVCRDALAKLAPETSRALAAEESRLRAEALAYLDTKGALHWGFDYVLSARTSGDIR